MKRKMKRFSYEEIEVIIEDVRKSIWYVKHENNGIDETICIYIPDYFRIVLNMYFRGRFSTNQPFRAIEFGNDSSFYGIKNFYPSPFNQIIISDIKAPQYKELFKIIEL
jgi:hypothetical protein